MKLVSIHKQAIILMLLIIASQGVKAQSWGLQQCIDTAQVHNKNLQISRNNIAISEQKKKEATANLIPKISANADYKYFTNLPYQFMPLSTFNPTAPEGQFKEAQFGVPHNINANLQLMMPLYNSQIYGAIKTTKISSELNELQYQKTEEQVFFEISNLYYNAQILLHQLVFLDSNLTNAERLLKNIKLLHEQLLAKGTDVAKVKLQVAQLSTQKETISSKYTQVINALNFTMGRTINQKLEIEQRVEYTAASDYQLLSNVDIRIAQTQNRLLKNDLNNLRKSKFLPSINLMGSYGSTGFGYDKQPNDFLKFYPIGYAGILLSYPIFNGTVTQRKINQKKIELENNALQTELLNEQNNMQIENALGQRNVATKSVSTATEQIELAKTIYTQTILQQKQGTASLSDVLLADNALREAQQNYISAVIDFLKADLEIKKLTGNFISNK